MCGGFDLGQFQVQEDLLQCRHLHDPAPDIDGAEKGDIAALLHNASIAGLSVAVTVWPPE